MHFFFFNAQESLQQISGSPAGTYRYLTEQRMGRLCSQLDYASIKDIIQLGLHEYIDSFQVQLNVMGEAVRGDFFTPHRYRRTQTRVEASQMQSS